MYVGSSINIENRITTHIYALKKNKHHNIKLQNSWNKYGDKQFVFKPLMYCGKDVLCSTEQNIIDIMINNFPGKTFNIATNVELGESNRGKQRSEEVKNKISMANRGRKLAPKDKQRMQTINIGRKHSDEIKKKRSEILMNHQVSMTTREKIRKTLLGHPVSEETRKKMRRPKNKTLLKNVGLKVIEV
jgi:group I intron endonuclease